MSLFTISYKYKFKLQYHPSVCHNIIISPICFAFYYYITHNRAIQPRPCHTLMETVVPRNVQQFKTHQQPPFSMAIISALSSKTTLTNYFSNRGLRQIQEATCCVLTEFLAGPKLIGLQFLSTSQFHLNPSCRRGPLRVAILNKSCCN